MNWSAFRVSSRNWGHPLNWFFGVVFLGILTYLVWSGIHSPSNQSIQLVVYAFSTQEEVLTQGIFPAFKKAWEIETGENVDIEGIFGPSGTLSVQITMGAPADIAIFSNQRHVDWLKFSKCVDRNTDQVMVASTPLVIVTRPGNPKGISDYVDLTQPDIQLLHADPRSSGVGEWTVLGEYGSSFLETGDDNIAKSFLKDIWGNVRLVGSSARATLTLFEIGAGDALVTYEQDAYFARERGIPLEINTPKRTILTRNYAVIVDDNVTRVERPVVEAFMAYVQSEEGQKIFSQYYFRTISIENGNLPDLGLHFTEDDLGGWYKAHNSLIENYWKIEIEPYLELEPAATFLGIGE